MRMTCPTCNSPVNTIRSKTLTPLIRELYHVCRNKKCGHIFVSQQAIMRSVLPSELDGSEFAQIPKLA